MPTQTTLLVTTDMPANHCGSVMLNTGPGFNGLPMDLTAMEADGLANDLRQAANRVRSHNATVSRPRWP